MTQRPARHLAHLLVVIVASLVGMVAAPRLAAAHNTIESSIPGDGSSLDAAPAEITLVFAKSVPLETISVQLVEASGARRDLGDFRYGANGDREVIVPLPPLTGEVSIRWRLVGSDGHAITGRVGFIVAAPVATIAPAVTVAPVVAAAVTVPPVLTVAPGVTVAAPVAVPVEPGTGETAGDTTVSSTLIDTTSVVSSAVPESVEASGSTPSAVRWLLRLIAYLAMALIAGVGVMATFVWPAVWGQGGVRRLVGWSVAASAIAAIGQLLVIAGDIAGRSPFASTGKLNGALHTDAGAALLIRVVLVAVLAGVVFLAPSLDDEHRWVGAVGISVLMLVTWAYAGHSASQRWSLIGIPLDVGHHGAAAMWLGALGMMAFIVARSCEGDVLVAVVGRFAWLAGRLVLVIVITGVLQAWRLVGGISGLFNGTHGRLMLLKLVIVGLMLKVADVNRKRVTRRFASGVVGPRTVDTLRRAMVTELAVGALVIGVTAALVVSSPASAADDAGSATPEPTSSSLVVIVTSPPPLATPPTTLPCTISATLRLGDSGEPVRCLQAALVRNGFAAAEPTGTFDEATDVAVRAAEAARSLAVDGIVGPKTGASLGIWAEA